ncbi:hypothetical protein L798_08539 [Zootermopsis nevadensis]|uniref:Uncharacterized protein n=1 Tax=Zootermopsis nevadensis TaxID=136037 RepID=A0A067R343_ZOONE|nr:hypothetical protein L798_08539 [Zootermopsis nevadensis]
MAATIDRSRPWLTVFLSVIYHHNPVTERMFVSALSICVLRRRIDSRYVFRSRNYKETAGQRGMKGKGLGSKTFESRTCAKQLPQSSSGVADVVLLVVWDIRVINRKIIFSKSLIFSHLRLRQEVKLCGANNQERGS